ncbi:ribulose-5-phosphate 4-epimerase related epimerase / aldolase [Klebsiella grimontii]|nr:ribulose-5-phosphate 4-epimerase related epimerase / aldolase [Klebsiella grimontii]
MARSYEEQTRIDLAATFRIIAHLGMHEAVANHFSAALSADGKKIPAEPEMETLFAPPRQRPAAAGRR